MKKLVSLLMALALCASCLAFTSCSESKAQYTVGVVQLVEHVALDAATEGFKEAFAGSGAVLNARIVGTPDLVCEKVQSLWTKGMKLIVVTYCETPEEQAEVYRRIHEICR